MGRSWRVAVGTCVLGWLTHGSAQVAHADGEFSVLSYNIAGLLEPISQSRPAVNTPIISCKIRGYTLVNVQEDFNYHRQLYDRCDDHPHRTQTSGPMGFGSGLNTLSYLPFADLGRVKWDDCSGFDCLTPKGFTHTRVRLSQGAYLTLYNMHAQAHAEPGDLEARRKNVLQLLQHIEAHAPADTIVLMGDTNTRYTRAGDNVRELLRHGFRDVWVDLVRDGLVPWQGSSSLRDCADLSSAQCEVVDKVLYREGAHVTLRPLSYHVDRKVFVDAAGEPLSDHYPVMVDFEHGTTGRFRLSDLVGGSGGRAFDDTGVLPLAPSLRKVVLRSAARVDRVEAVLDSGAVTSHGGMGGSESSLTLANDEWLTSLEVCVDAWWGQRRVFGVVFTTSRGRTLSGGRSTRECTRFQAPSGFAIVGFHGRAGGEVDKLGAVFAPRAGEHGAAPSMQIKNLRTGLCLDIAGGVPLPWRRVQQATCAQRDSQRWMHDPTTGLLRSKLDPRLCVDNGGYYGDGADVQLAACTGSANQRFVVNASRGTVHLRTAPEQVLDGVGAFSGEDVITWSDNGADHQRWSFVP